MRRRLGCLAVSLTVLSSTANESSCREPPAAMREARKCAFSLLPTRPRLSVAVAAAATDRPDAPELDPTVAGRFKILTCSSNSCVKQRRALGMDEFATFAAFYSRVHGAGAPVAVEEAPCLGACQRAPCVAVEHEDYIGPVALEGMDPDEFRARVFHRIVTKDDADRVWSAVQQAIHIMSSQDTGSAETDNATIDEFI